MFSTKEQLIKKTGKHGIGRLDFLEQLINEYNNTKSRGAKEQVLANLANFAYDPVNYDYLWRLKVLDLFLNALEDNNKKIVLYAIGGICNICLEPLSREYIIRNKGIKAISNLLSRTEESIILSSITTLIYLDTPNSRRDIISPENVKHMVEFSKSSNDRIKNLALIFLEDLCGIKENKEFGVSNNTNVNSSGNFNKYKNTISQASERKKNTATIAVSSKAADSIAGTSTNTSTLSNSYY